MSRTLKLLFRRDPSRDRQEERIHFEGYQICWPDNGQKVNVGVDALCKHGQRLLGLGKHLQGCREKLISMILFPLTGQDDDLNRLPGHRVRRFYLERNGNIGRLHFMDGTPTTATFDTTRDEPHMLHWLGLYGLGDGERLWFDLAATSADQAPQLHHPHLAAIPCQV